MCEIFHNLLDSRQRHPVVSAVSSEETEQSFSAAAKGANKKGLKGKIKKWFCAKTPVA